jgi:two-component system sensor kinase FixL
MDHVPSDLGTLHAVMDAAVDAVILIDHRGLVSAFNRSAEGLFGYSALEAIGRDVNLLMPQPDREHHDEYLDRHASTGVAHVIGVGREVEGVRKDGSVFPALLSVGRIADSALARFVGIIRDITDEKRAQLQLLGELDRATAAENAEQQARLLQQRLVQVGRLATLGEMAAGIAHELNQPLSAIATYARACERFLSMVKPDLEESRAAMHEIVHEAMRAGAIIQRLRQLVSSQPSVQKTVNLNLVIESLSHLAFADARVHNVQITLQLDRSIPPLRGDPAQLQQLIFCLVGNAIEALASNGDGDRQILIRTDVSGSQVVVTIRDNGPGVAPHLVKRLFMPFYTTKAGGTGLGLSMSHTIANAHGGSIEYQAADPRGACFAVRLPAASDCDE